MWQQAVPATQYAWADAVAYCPTLTLAGHSDWRLPSIIELSSIVDYGQQSPSINPTYFPSTPADYFWSSSSLGGSSSSAWGVDFYYGSTGYHGVSDTGLVRCVR
jgi:formylglycine-generating enzyme required for sulfatase activity